MNDFLYRVVLLVVKLLYMYVSNIGNDIEELGERIIFFFKPNSIRLTA